MGLLALIFLFIIIGSLFSSGSSAGADCEGSMHMFDLDGNGKLDAGEFFIMDSFLNDDGDL